MSDDLQTTPIPETKCLTCGKVLDCASGVGQTPRENSISICFGCGNLAIFAADLTLQPLTQEIWDQIPHGEQTRISEVQYDIRRLRRKRVDASLASQKRKRYLS